MRALVGPRVLALAALLGSAVAPASAGGSLGLDDVLEAVKTVPKLVAEIRAELDKANVKVTDVTCVGSRHGNHWTQLGGARAAPYECEIGPRALKIEADRVYFDGRGKPLGDLKKVSSKRAKTFREDNFHWTWTP